MPDVPRSEVARARGDIHHELSPIIGALRLAIHHGEPLTAVQMAEAVQRLYRATDRMDALLGEKPMREQIAEYKAAHGINDTVGASQ